MVLPREFFDIQVKFAQRASELSGLTIQDSLFKYTFLYRNFFVPSKRFNKKDKIWMEFVQTLYNTADKNITDVVYDYSAKRMKEKNMYDQSFYTGKSCFTYSIKGDSVYLHFNNLEGSEPGPLSNNRIKARKMELVNIFKEIKSKHPEVHVVRGYSWLYNLQAYCRLFPSEYTTNRKVVKTDFRHMDIWGQFLDSSYSLKTEFANNFIARINKATDIKELKSIFDFYPIKVEAPISVFFEFYGI